MSLAQWLTPQLQLEPWPEGLAVVRQLGAKLGLQPVPRRLAALSGLKLANLSALGSASQLTAFQARRPGLKQELLPVWQPVPKS